jgi:hypothetical protein
VGPVVVHGALLYELFTGSLRDLVMGSLGVHVASHFELFSLYASFPWFLLASCALVCTAHDQLPTGISIFLFYCCAKRFQKLRLVCHV